MIDLGDVDIYLGLDVGKGEHHGCALTSAGKRVFDKRLPNTEPKLRAVFDKLRARFGTVLVIVDQPASIGALPLTVARDSGCQVAYLPGLAMRRIADLYLGEAKTDARDAHVIADAARTMPHTLRALELADQTAVQLAAYASLAPATRSSGSSIRGEHPSRRGNKQHKRAFFLAAFASLNDPASRAYYDKEIAQGKVASWLLYRRSPAAPPTRFSGSPVASVGR